MRRVLDNDYYVICLKLHFRKLFIIWVSSDVDCVLLNESLKIIAFSEFDEVKQFALDQQITLNADLTIYDITLLQNWLIEPGGDFDDELFLNLWNLFIDITESLKVDFLGDNKNDVRNAVYDKLFDIAGPFKAENPNPTFTKAQVKVLSEIMQDGLNTLVSNVSLSI